MHWVHPSVAYRSFRVPLLDHSRPASFDPNSTYQGFRPSCAALASASTFVQEIPNPTLSYAHRLSQPPDVFLRTHVRGLISSHRPRSGFRPVQGFLSPRSAPSLIGRSCPHAVVVQSLAGRDRQPCLHAPTSRLSSTRSRVRYGLGLAAPQVAPLIRFPFLPGDSSSRRELLLPGAIRL
jgi:hypothetical protein